MKESEAQSGVWGAWFEDTCTSGLDSGRRFPAHFLACLSATFCSQPSLSRMGMNGEIEGLYRKILCWLWAGWELKYINQKRLLFVAVFGCVCTHRWYWYCRRSFNPFIQIYKKCCFLSVLKKKKSKRAFDLRNQNSRKCIRESSSIWGIMKYKKYSIKAPLLL